MKAINAKVDGSFYYFVTALSISVEIATGNLTCKVQYTTSSCALCDNYRQMCIAHVMGVQDS